MNNETYEALKELVDYLNTTKGEFRRNDLKQVIDWIDEVAKEYED